MRNRMLLHRKPLRYDPVVLGQRLNLWASGPCSQLPARTTLSDHEAPFDLIHVAPSIPCKRLRGSGHLRDEVTAMTRAG